MYDKIASLYDLVHVDLTEDVNFLIALAEQLGGPILELGCGTGRVLLPLARAGHHITGVDRSSAMLDRAKQKLLGESESVRSRVNLVIGDMNSIQLNSEFELAIVSYNTFMHFEKATKTALLNTIREHLLPDGTLFIDVDNPFEISDASDDVFVLERTMMDPETGNTIIQSASSWVDTDAQYRHITWLFDVSPQSGGPVHRTIAEADYHYLFPHELETALVGSGFRLKALLGGYDGEPFGEETPRLIALAKANDHYSQARELR